MELIHYYPAYLNLLWMVVVYSLLKDSLKDFVRGNAKWRNLLLLIAGGCLTIWFFNSVKSPLADVITIPCFQHSCPIYDNLVFCIIGPLLEECRKWLAICVILLLAKLLNRKLPMEWLSVFVVLFVANVFSASEAENHWNAHDFELYRVLFPLHYMQCFPAANLLFNVIKNRRWTRLPLVFGAAWGMHTIFNFAGLLGTDIKVYLVANDNYSLLVNIQFILTCLCQALLGVFVALLMLRLLLAQENVVFRRFFTSLESLLLKASFGKAMHPLLLAIALEILFSLIIIASYYRQTIKPITIKEYSFISNEAITTEGNTIRVDESEIVKYIDEKGICEVPYSYMRIFHKEPPYYYFVNGKSIKQYIAYKGIVVCVFDKRYSRKETYTEVYPKPAGVCSEEDKPVVQDIIHIFDDYIRKENHYRESDGEDLYFESICTKRFLDEYWECANKGIGLSLDPILGVPIMGKNYLDSVILLSLKGDTGTVKITFGNWREYDSTYHYHSRKAVMVQENGKWMIDCFLQE